jgi:peptidoglycan/LPS O-acetylase OafA/YrhL
MQGPLGSARLFPIRSDYTCDEVRGLKRRRNILSWAGFAIVLVALVSYIPFFALFPATRDIPWANYVLFLIGGALLAVGVRRAFRDPERYRGKVSGSILAALSFLLFAFFMATVTYFGKQIPSAATALGVSRKAPPFVLVDTTGKQVSSAGLLNDHRGLVLVFYRGYW